MAQVELLQTIRRHSRCAVLVFAGAILACAAVNGFRPPSFSATSTVLIAPDPAAFKWQEGSVPFPIYQSFHSKKMSLTENAVASRAVRLMKGGSTFINPSFAAIDPTEVSRLQSHYEQTTAGISEQKLVRRLIRSTATDHIHRAQLVKVSVVDPDPKVALLSSWALIEASEQFHAERVFAPTVEHKSRLVLRLANVERELAAALDHQEQLAEQRPVYRERKSALRIALKDLWVEQNRLLELSSLTEKQMKDPENPVASVAPPPDFALGRRAISISEELDRAILQLTETRATASESHPKTGQAIARIAALRRRLEQLPGPDVRRERLNSVLLEQIENVQQDSRIKLAAVEEVLDIAQNDLATLARGNVEVTSARLEVLLLESIQ